MKILVDMNLSPDWCDVLREQGWESEHWASIGDPRATDQTIMAWAVSHGYIVFTHDLDYGAILATTRANGPSVIQFRTQDVLPDRLGSLVISTLRLHEAILGTGALISVDEVRSRVRILPLA